MVRFMTGTQGCPSPIPHRWPTHLAHQKSRERNEANVFLCLIRTRRVPRTWQMMEFAKDCVSENAQASIFNRGFKLLGGVCGSAPPHFGVIASRIRSSPLDRMMQDISPGAWLVPKYTQCTPDVQSRPSPTEGSGVHSQEN